MYKPRIPVTLIAAMGPNREIGKKNALPWYVPEDLKHFEKETLGKVMVVGRKTWEQVGSLAGRITLVVSSTLTQENVSAECQDRTEVYPTLEGALQRAEVLTYRALGKEIMVIGGEEIYRLALPIADRLLITRIDIEVEEADAFFPEFSEREFLLTVSSPRYNSTCGKAFSFFEWKRRQPAKFKEGQKVLHERGSEYIILQTPDHGLRLEATGEPAYSYQAPYGFMEMPGPIWVRGAKEMEDGRFTAVGT